MDAADPMPCNFGLLSRLGSYSFSPVQVTWRSQRRVLYRPVQNAGMETTKSSLMEKCCRSPLRCRLAKVLFQQTLVKLKGSA